MDINLLLKDPKSGLTKDLVPSRTDLLALKLPSRLIRICNTFPVKETDFLSVEIDEKYLSHKDL